MAEISTYQKVEALIKKCSVQELGQIRDLVKHQMIVNGREDDTPYAGYEGRTIIILGKFKFYDYDVEDYQTIFFNSYIKDWGTLKEGIYYVIFKDNSGMDAILSKRNFELNGNHLAAFSVQEYEASTSH